MLHLTTPDADHMLYEITYTFRMPAGTRIMHENRDELTTELQVEPGREPVLRLSFHGKRIGYAVISNVSAKTLYKDAVEKSVDVVEHSVHVRKGVQVIADFIDWSRTTFGNAYRRGSQGPLMHFQKEYAEYKAATDPANEREELIDMIFLAYDAYWRAYDHYSGDVAIARVIDDHNPRPSMRPLVRQTEHKIASPKSLELAIEKLVTDLLAIKHGEKGHVDLDIYRQSEYRRTDDEFAIQELKREHLLTYLDMLQDLIRYTETLFFVLYQTSTAVADFSAKLEKNKARSWPTAIDATAPVEHIDGGDRTA